MKQSIDTRLNKALRKDEKNRQRRVTVREVLDQCDKKAQHMNADAPTNVRWAAVAYDLGVSIHTVQYWARKGYIPKGPAVALSRRYGAKVVKVEDVLAPTA